MVSPIYDNSKVDVNRINVSLSHKLGSKIYGVGNPNPSGYKLDVKKLKDELGYYEIKFGMNSESVIDTTSHQVSNLPNNLENLVVICGSGLNLLGILKGIVKYKKKVSNVYGITLSKFFDENKKLYYDNLVDKEKYSGQLHIIRSPYPYQRLLKTDIPFCDWTYESKAYSFMTVAGGKIKRGFGNGGSFKEVMEEVVCLDDLRKDHGLQAAGSWDQAFDKIDERRKQYILTLQRNGEDILPTSKPRIRLSTIHGAKGDEDENIVHFLDLDILSYNEFQRNPSPEHRLQFVGVTRTVSNLYIVNPTGQYGYQI